MTALLCALSLTKATMWFAQKNKGEIAAGYAELISLEQEAPQDFVQAQKRRVWGSGETIFLSCPFISNPPNCLYVRPAPGVCKFQTDFSDVLHNPTMQTIVWMGPKPYAWQNVSQI